MQRAGADFPQVLDAAEPGMNLRLPSSAVEARLINPLCDSDWDCLVASHPDASFFHSAAWAKVLNKTYGHAPFYLHFTQHGETVALMPMMEVRSPLTGRRGVCLPFTDSCDP